MKTLITLLFALAMAATTFAQLKDTTVLKEVIIKAKKPLLTQAIDRTIVNVDAMLSSAASNTLEVLEKTPGVSVNSNGEISLNGRSGVLVLINGRSTYLSGPDLAAYLKSIPGATLDKIELIDNPPARYDASGSAIINIRIKKNKKPGFTGAVSVAGSQGRYARTNDAVSLNYNTVKVGVFTNIGYNAEKSYASDESERRFFNTSGDQTSTILLDNHTLSRRHGVNLNTGVDYSLSKKTTVGAMLNVNTGSGHSVLDYETQELKGRTSNDQDRMNIGANMNMVHRFTDKGHELSVETNYLRYKATGYQEMADFIYDLPSDFKIYSANIDYVLPLDNKFKFEAGVKSSVVDNNSVYDFYDVIGTVKTIDESKSNHYNYWENTSAGYANAQKAWNRLGIQAGLRAEYTTLKGKRPGHGTLFTKDYTRLFPSLFLQYKLDSNGKNTLGFMITRRINRPNYQRMNPFLLFRDTYSYTEGNPALGPQYQNRYELKFQHRQLLNMGLSYNRFTDVIFQTTEAVDTVFITRPNNVAKGFMAILNTTVTMSPVKWWNFNATLRLSHLGLKGRVNSEALTPRTNIARFELQNFFTISKTVSAELGAYYASRDLAGQTFTQGMYRVFSSFQKKMFNDKASVRLSFDDIFHSWVYKNHSIGLKQADSYEVSESDTQRIAVSFSYRFGKSTVNRKRHRNSADEERSRAE